MSLPCSGVDITIPLTATITGSQSLTLEWQTDCPNARILNSKSTATSFTLTAPTGSVPPISCSVTLNVGGGAALCSTEIATEACEVDCKGKLILTDSQAPGKNSRLDQCGVCDGDGTSCTGCTSKNITTVQLSLDGNGLAQRNLVLKAGRTLLNKNRTVTKSLRRFVLNTFSQAQASYEALWSTTWSMPGVVLSCTNNELCHNVSVNQYLTNYHENSDTLSNLLKKIISKMKIVGISKLTIRKLNHRARKLENERIATLKSLPSEISSCSSSK